LPEPALLPSLRGLKQRALSAGRWSVFGFAASQGIRLVTTLVMTRLLVPSMFGVMAIALMVNMIASLLTDLGIRQNIVQRHRGDDTLFLDTAWTVQIVRGVVIWAVALAVSAALYAASHFGYLSGDTVYGAPVLPWVLAVSSFSVVVSGFQSTKGAVAERGLNQRRLIQIDLSCQLVAFVFMVGMAYATRSIWSLVAGQLVAGLMSVMLNHLALPGHANRIAWDPASLKEIVAFGKWIFAASFVGVFALYADRIVLGGLVSASVLGQFAIAATLVAAVQGVFSKLYATVVMPVLSETARDDRSRLKEVFYRVRIPTDLTLLFCAGFLAATGQLIVGILYDQRYAEAGWMLEILALSLVWARYDASLQLYLALGQPRFVALLNFARFASVFVALLVGFRLDGIRGAIWGFTLHQIVNALLSYRFNAILRINDFARDLGVLVALPIGYGAGLGLVRLVGR
jgi:O-antigen/teichoic acid export membrane protein